MTWLPIVDGHADTLTCLSEQDRTLIGPEPRGQSDAGRLIEAGIALQVLAICSEDNRLGLAETLGLIDRFRQELAGSSTVFSVESNRDLDDLAPGKVGFLLSLEGAGLLGNDPGLLRIFFRLGVRLLGLTWNGRNQFADGVKVEGGGGLTGRGRELLALAEELGIVVDLAHLNTAGFWQAVEAARRPLVVSHANARALCDHPRNLDDSQIRAIAAGGGLVGVMLFPPFLRPDHAAATSEDVLRHLEHLLNVAGPQAVGFGFDFDGIDDAPADLPDITAIPRLLTLIDRIGLAEAERAALLGQNWLRIFRQVLP